MNQLGQAQQSGGAGCNTFRLVVEITIEITTKGEIHHKYFSQCTERNVHSEFHHSKYTTYLTTCFTTKCGDARPGEVHLKIW